MDYGVIDYGTLRFFMLSFVSNPYTSGFTAPALAAALAGLERGNGTLLWEGHSSLQGIRTLECACDGPTQQTQMAFQSEMAIVIACTDGDPVHDSVKQLEAWYERNAKLTSYADVWSFRVSCAYVHSCEVVCIRSHPLQRMEDSSCGALHGPGRRQHELPPPLHRQHRGPRRSVGEREGHVYQVPGLGRAHPRWAWCTFPSMYTHNHSLTALRSIPRSRALARARCTPLARISRTGRCRPPARSAQWRRPCSALAKLSRPSRAASSQTLFVSLRGMCRSSRLGF
jgi:hypothetical protein